MGLNLFSKNPRSHAFRQHPLVGRHRRERERERERDRERIKIFPRSMPGTPTPHMQGKNKQKSCNVGKIAPRRKINTSGHIYGGGFVVCLCFVPFCKAKAVFFGHHEAEVPDKSNDHQRNWQKVGPNPNILKRTVFSGVFWDILSWIFANMLFNK